MSTQIAITEFLVQRIVRICARIIWVVRKKSISESLDLVRILVPRTHLWNIVTALTEEEHD